MKKRVLMTGAGFIGRSLKDFLEKSDYEVWILSRSESSDPRRLQWSWQEEKMDALPEADWEAIIHLAGEPVFGPWTQKKKDAIMHSRSEGTAFLLKELKRQNQQFKLFVSASGISIYQDSEEEFTEDGPTGNHFLAQVVKEWEKASDILDEEGIRRVLLRTPMVLAPNGGPLKTMLPAFKMALGGPIGHGRQYMSWVSLQDYCRLIQFAIEHENLSGVINACNNSALTNKEFSKTLAKALNRPCFLPAPAFALKLVLGQFAKETVLWSTRAKSAKLERCGFEFKDLVLAKTFEGFFQ